MPHLAYARTRHGRGHGLLVTATVAFVAVAFAMPAEAQRIVLVMEPPSVETNKFWENAGEAPPPFAQGLVGHDPHTGVYDGSGLAESWEHDEDFTAWTFHLHENAEFHFGWGPVTAEDVAHSYAYHTGPDAVQVGASLLVGADVEIVDDHTVTFHLPEPRPNYLFAHAGRGSMVVYSKAQYDAEGLEGYDRMPAGTAAIEYVSHEVGRGILLRRVDDHWSGTDVPFDELEIRYAPEASTRLAMLLAGEGDISVLPRELQPDATDAGFEIISSTGPAMQTGFFFNGLYTLPEDDALDPDLPWLDVRIREAINRAIDQEVMLEVLYDGRADPLVQYAMDPRHEGYAAELEARFEDWYGYDPERAAELLAEAGYPDAFADPTIPLVVVTMAGNPEFEVMAELMQVFLDEVGLRTEIIELDHAGLTAARRGREARFLHPMRNAPVRPTELGIMHHFTSHNRPFNFTEDETTEKLFEQYTATLDPESRDQLAKQIFTHLFDNYMSVPIAGIAAEVVVNPATVAGWTFPGVTSRGLSHWHLIQPTE